MKINSNTQANSLQGLSSQFLRLQKQRQAAREQTAQNTQTFAAPREAQKIAVTEPKAQVVPVAQTTTTKSAPVAPAASDTVSLSASAITAQKAAAALPATGVAAETAKVKQAEAATTPTVSTATQTSTPATFTQKDVELFQNSFGAATGDERFNATYDLDGNGSINTLDLVRLLGRIG